LLGLTPGIVAGFHRGPDQVRNHGFFGPLDERPGLPRLLDTAAALSGSAGIEDSELLVEASVTNVQAGHALPTGEPLRSMLMVVDARCDDLALTQTAGPALSPVAGALATGTVGQEVIVGNVSLFWEELEGVPLDAPVRLTGFRPTGSYLDYEGVGPFASGEGNFPTSGKGLPDLTPLGSLEVIQSSPGILTPGAVLPFEAGDLVIVSEVFEEPVEDGSARMLAGQAGIDFARVLADSEENWPVPHYRAVDILRDNRLRPHLSDARSYRFTLPEDCSDPSVQLFLVYRSYPPGLARERGWDSRDHLMATRVLSLD
ncbi:MAG: hypothetical protein VX498_10390, partial [Myxococcota bacterium]|nr:hypothetical protein [Myxococcota bacterium]